MEVEEEEEEETTISIETDLLEHFARHQPQLEPFDDFNELTVDTGVACVTRQVDCTLLFSGGNSGDNNITIAQWQNRLHINYRSWVDASSFNCFEVSLSPRFCKRGENRVAYRLYNRFDDTAYMKGLEETQPVPIDDIALINGHPWHANSESYFPLDGPTLQLLWYVPAEWADRLNAMPGPQRNELLDRHSKRVDELFTTANANDTPLSYEEKTALCEEVVRIHAHNLENSMTSDIEHMKQWAFVGYCEMVARAERAGGYLRQLDECRMIPRSHWVLHPSSNTVFFINMHPSTSLTLCNASTEPWPLKGCNYNGSLAPAHSIQFDCDEKGGITYEMSTKM